MTDERKVHILGEEWTVAVRNRKDDDNLNDKDGYCDKTSKLIVVADKDDESDLQNYTVYLQKVCRHEIIHAYLFESGLHENFEHPRLGHDETYVDWIAVQFPKLLETFREVGCI